MKYTIKELREKNGMTQRDVANHLGVDQRTVSVWENSNELPKNVVLYALANLYNASITDIKVNN